MRSFLSTSSLSTQIALALSLALSPLAAGCGGTTAIDGPAVTAAGGTKAPLATPAHGRLKVFGDALAEVPLRAEQRAEIEQMTGVAEARQASVRALHNEVMTALAAQIEQGSIDRTALQTKVDAAKAAFAVAAPLDHAALEHLHAILDPAQRAAFADAVQAKMEAKRSEHAGRGHRMDEWATALKLTDAQRSQIRDMLKDQLAEHRGEWKGPHEHGGKMMEAFRNEHFVVGEGVPAEEVSARTTKRTERFERFLGIAQVVLPVLTPEQRSLAAAKLRAQAADTNEVEP